MFKVFLDTTRCPLMCLFLEIVGIVCVPGDIERVRFGTGRLDYPRKQEVGDPCCRGAGFRFHRADRMQRRLYFAGHIPPWFHGSGLP